jgi:hypothetical protein
MLPADQGDCIPISAGPNSVHLLSAARSALKRCLHALGRVLPILPAAIGIRHVHNAQDILQIQVLYRVCKPCMGQIHHLVIKLMVEGVLGQRSKC